MPLISVVLPVFNSEKYISESVRSILDQTMADFELIIIDDGSKDGTPAILEVLKNQDSRIIIISRENKGLVFSLNEGISLARGKWIARMDADDIALPNRFARQLAWLELTGSDICGSWIKFFGGNDQRIWKTFISDEAIKIDMLFKCPLMHPTIIMKSDVGKTLQYDMSYEKAEDYDLWVRAAIFGWKMTNVPEVLLLYRQHSDQISIKSSELQKCLTRKIKLQYWSYISSSIKIDKIDFENIINVDNSDFKLNGKRLTQTLMNLIKISSGESKDAVIANIPRLYLQSASSSPKILFTLKHLSNVGARFSIGFKVQLTLMCLFRVKYNSKIVERLVRTLNFARNTFKI